MSLKDKMDEESESVEAIFLDYISSKSSVDIFLFFEGVDDQKYYLSIIESNHNFNRYKKGFNHYICRGKEKVVEIHKMIVDQASNCTNNVKMFFVDSDFDDNSLLDKDIFVTPTYSIENLYFTDNAIKRIIMEMMGISSHSKDDEEDSRIAFDHIIKRRNDIIKEIIYGNACFSLQIKKAYELGIKKPNLTQIKKYDDIKSVSKFEDIKGKIEDAIDITEEEIEEECLRIEVDPVRFIRGKYLLEKMPKEIMKLIEEINKGIYGDIKFSKRRKIPLDIKEATIVSNLSHCAERPQELLDYIEERLEKC